MSEGEGLLGELRRRKVLRAAVIYAAAAFAVLEFADIAFPRLGLPDGAVDVVLWAGLLGFPVALALAWAFDVVAEPSSTGWFSAPSLAVAAVLVGLGLAAGWWFGTSGEPERPAGRPERGTTIAVLAFADLHGGEHGYFSHGLSEDIGAALSRFADLTVLSPRTTAGAEDGDPVSAGREFGARFVLGGSVRRDADAVRVTAELIDAETGAQLWSERYDRDLTTADLFAVQDDIADRVVATLAGSAGVITRTAQRESRRRTPASLEAYDCVLRSYRYFYVHEAGVHAEARDCLEGAIAIEPDYADIWAHLAYLYREEYLHRWNARPRPLERALEAADRALALDADNPMAYFALAVTHFSRRDFEAARTSSERALALNPNDATIVAALGSHWVWAGDRERGIALVKRASALTPRHPTWLYNAFGIDLYMRGEYEAALAEFKKISRGDPTVRIPEAAIHGRLGRPREARAVLDPLLANFPHLAESPMEELRRIYLSDELVEALAEGLRRAGMAL